MDTQYTWKTGLFNSKFEILKEDFHAGMLTKGFFPGKAEGELFGRRVQFRTKGIFRFETRIIDIHNEQELGIIRFRNLRTKASVIYKNTEYYCQFENYFRTKWILSDENGPLVKYYSRAFHGIITSSTSDEVLILSGFFIRNFIKARTAAIAASS